MEGKKFYIEYEEQENGISVVKKMEEYFEQNQVYEPESVGIGYWEEAWEEDPGKIIEYMVENKDKFPNLKRIHLGDMTSEECEISWIVHTNTSPLVNEFNLNELRIDGCNGLRLSNMESNTLKKLTIVCGGLENTVIEDIQNAKLPNLEHLQLYIGVDDYGFEGDIDTLKPFMNKNNFPKVKYLGLVNSQIQDEICETVLESDILEQLTVLDLSYGTLSDKSGKLILENIHKIKHLEKLDLTYNYMSDEVVNELVKVFEKIETELLISREEVYLDEDDDWRYPYITE
ncbi:STM4015 family protein [Oceanirhabdus sp. W0125-5]|uniref:STM4015 family protein n=1 Tax=Oceanirhabdus sp. W0125-5 TaxID=2999116 RepID=UPI0022F2BEA2|nr:STM4015 family protein [Oceanirhabdus sp. W0125-5]WBW98352.1 STM4015 family protein [Oceanirhabdus sp. W0125-5]